MKLSDDHYYITPKIKYSKLAKEFRFKRHPQIKADTYLCSLYLIIQVFIPFI